MAYTDSTLNYQIPLPQANDTFNPLDWNESAEKIDTAIHNASQIADTARDDLVKVKKEVVNLQTGLGETDDRATALTARVGVLEQNDNTYAEGIKDLGDMFTAREVQQAQSDVEIGVGKWFRYNGVLYVCTVEIKVGDTIVPNVNCRATNVESEMPTGSGGLTDRIEILEADDTLLKNRLNIVEPKVTSLENVTGDTSIVGIADSTVTSAIVSFNNKIGSTSLSGIGDGSATGAISDVEARLVEMTARVEALEKGEGMVLDFSNATFTEGVSPSLTMTKKGVCYVTIIDSDTSGASIYINEKQILHLNSPDVVGAVYEFPVEKDTIIRVSHADKSTITGIPYKVE